MNKIDDLSIDKGINVLSLFDGMACGMLAMQKAGLNVDNYYAYEIDKYAIQTVKHNFPEIQELGDVFAADFKKYNGIDFLIGGSPCTYWSIAQSKDKRETTASGVGWELFSQYARALNEAKPKYFIYENNKSMAKAIYQSISETFGFEAICINSALVSAQNRQRLYWVGKRNADGTYSKVDIQQPKDKQILLRDVLDSNGYDLTSNDKSYTLTASYNGAVAWNTIERPQRNMVIEPVNTTEGGKSQTIKAQYSNTDVNNICRYTSTFGASGVAELVNTSKQVGSLPRPNGELSQSQAFRIYDTNAKSVTLKAEGGGAGGKTGLYAIPIDKDISENHTITNGINKIIDSKGYVPEMFNAYNKNEIIDKSPTLTTGSMVTSSCAVNLFQKVSFTIPIEWKNNKPIKAVSYTDGKTYKVYEVKNNLITIKEKQYPIKLQDGYYIIRKLTVSECKRLQTVPEWYEFTVSDTQAYKMLGNGWTVDVIAHILKSIKED